MCMEDFGATAFACTPSYALYLGEAAKEAGVVDRLQLKAGINGAEPWTDEMRRKIEELLNVNSFDIYGLCEITGPGVALDCIHHKGMHVQEDYFYPEVLNPTDHTPCKDGAVSYTHLDVYKRQPGDRMGKGQQADCCDGTQKRESGRTYA